MSKTLIQPNLKMTEDLAYLFGAIKGDGHVSNDTKYLHSNGRCWHQFYTISFFNQDFEFSRKIYHIMKDIGLNSYLYYRKTCLQINACSKILWEWYQELSLTEFESMLKEDRKYLIAFIRGFYEAEGCFYYETGVKRPYVVITNSNEELISFIHRLICELGFNAKLYKIKRGKTAFKKGYYYHILIRKKNEAERFIEMINPCFKNQPTNRWFT